MRNDIPRLQRFMQKTFGCTGLEVRARPKKDDSAEVYVGEEFVGIVFKDEDEGELSYQFQMAILDIDLEDV